MSSRFDVVVLGCGPAGERAAIHAARAGRKVAVVERANVVGGTRVNWGTIPSKTLRESALFVRSVTSKKLDGLDVQVPSRITMAEFMYRERAVVQRELELINRTLGRYKIQVFHAHGRLVDPHTVALLGKAGNTRARIRGEVIIISTGSSPNHPDDVPFDDSHVLDSDSVLRLTKMPRSMVVLGAGVIGIEYASIFAALGLEVTLLDTREELLPYLDRETAGVLEQELLQLGITILHGDHYRTIERQNGATPRVRCETREGNVLEGEVLLYCVGRDGNTADLGLESLGIQPTPRGLLEVNAQFQTAVDHIYAVGDVIGYPALASTSMEQGRQAIRHALGEARPAAENKLLPFAIYSIPEVSYIGETEESLVQRGVTYSVGRGLYVRNPRGQIAGATGGQLKLLFEHAAAGDEQNNRLVGVHVVGHNASELVHVGQAMVQAGSSASQIAETLFNYPTLSDLYRHAALEALWSQNRS